MWPWTMTSPPNARSSASTAAGSVSRMRSETIPSSSSTAAADPRESTAAVAAATSSSELPSSRYALVSAWTTSQRPSRARGGSRVIHSTCSGVSERRSDSTPPLKSQSSRNVCPGMLVSSRPKRCTATSWTSWLPSRQRSAPPLSRSSPRARSTVPMPSGPRSTRSPTSHTRASAPDHRDAASTSPACRRSSTSTSRWPWTSPTTKTGGWPATGRVPARPSPPHGAARRPGAGARRRARASRPLRRAARAARARPRATPCRRGVA